MKLILKLLLLGLVLELIVPGEINPNEHLQHAWFAAITASIVLTMAAYQMYQSRQQAKKAEELASEPRPERGVPPSETRALETQSYLAGLTKAPGSEVAAAAAEERAAQSYSQSLDVARTGSEAQGFLEKRYSALSEEGRQREILDLQFQGQQQGRLSLAQQRMGGIEWDVETENVMNPYYRRMAAASALTQASEANKWGAINTAASGLSQAGGYYAGQGGGGGGGQGGGGAGAYAGWQARGDVRTGNYPIMTGQEGYYAGGGGRSRNPYTGGQYGGNPYAPGYYQYMG